LLTTCAKNTACPFYNGGDPGKAFDVLNAAADANPVATVKGRPNVTQGVLTTAISDAMYDQSYWGQLETALADLQKGDGKGVLALYDHYYNRSSKGTYGNELEAYFAINCLDDPYAIPAEQVPAEIPEFEQASPTFGAVFAWGLVGCSGMQVESTEKPLTVRGEGAAPIVVVGTTRDPATPYRWAEAMVEQLESGVLVSRDGDGHTGYNAGNACVDEAIEAYLIEATVPEDGLTC